MAISKKDYLDIARGRVTQQFKDKPNFDKLLRTWLKDPEDLQNTLSDIDDMKFIDKAEGVQLDNIGAIVGQPRLLVDADLIAFFGFQGKSISRSYGSLDDPSEGGRWKGLEEETTGNIELSDKEYRLFIKAKIIRNRADATTESVIESIKFLFQASKVHLLEGESPACYRVAIGSKLSQQEKNLVKYSYQDGVERTLLVKPAGVCFKNFSEFDPDNFFGFEGVVGAKGFGNLLEVGSYEPYYETFGMMGYGNLRDIADVSIERSYRTETLVSEALGDGSTFVNIPLRISQKDNAALLPYFGFEGDPAAQSYGSLYDSSLGSRWRSYYESVRGNVQVNDVEVFVGGSFEGNFVAGRNSISFSETIPRGTPVHAIQRFGQEVTTTEYTFKDPEKTLIEPFGNTRSLGDVNRPSLGSRYRSLGENDTANNILYEGPLKHISYDPPAETYQDVTLTEGGTYSSIIT